MNNQRMKPKKAITERINTVTPITIRYTPFTISLIMLQRMPATQRIPRTDKVYTSSPANRAICLKFKAIVLIFSMFLIFNADSRAEGVEFQSIYLPLVYPTFFLMRLSVASVVFVSGAPKGRD